MLRWFFLCSASTVASWPALVAITIRIVLFLCLRPPSYPSSQNLQSLSMFSVILFYLSQTIGIHHAQFCPRSPRLSVERDSFPDSMFGTHFYNRQISRKDFPWSFGDVNLNDCHKGFPLSISHLMDRLCSVGLFDLVWLEFMLVHEKIYIYIYKPIKQIR